MAQFVTDVVAHASDATSEPRSAPKCFNCNRGEVDAALARDTAVVWTCPRCSVEGRVSNWQGTLWDLRDQPPLTS